MMDEIVQFIVKYFGNFEPTCLTGTNKAFIEKYIRPCHSKDYPVPIEDALPVNWQELL
jgi:hypothetical protein